MLKTTLFPYFLPLVLLLLINNYSHHLYGGRCTGSQFCSACKNCRYCKYCNSGGVCGVCYGGSRYNRSPSAPIIDPQNDLLNLKPERPPSPELSLKSTYVVIASRLNLRSKPIIANNVVDTLYYGQEVNLIERFGLWTYISVKGKRGYVYNKYIR